LSSARSAVAAAAADDGAGNSGRTRHPLNAFIAF